MGKRLYFTNEVNYILWNQTHMTAPYNYHRYQHLLYDVFVSMFGVSCFELKINCHMEMFPAVGVYYK